MNLDMTPEQLTAARAWIADCEWGDLTRGEVAMLSPLTVVKGVQRFYEGGWEAFVADHTPAPQGEHYPLWESKGWLEQHSTLAAEPQWRGYDD